jgi:hypothetical protein
MTTLSQSQIKVYATSVGMGNPSLMAAIAMAESGGRSDVVNSIGCVGLWQINQPVHVKAHPSWTQAWLKNPLNNAIAAKSILNSQGLGAWEAYTNGAYKKYYSGSTVTSASWLGDVTNGAAQVIPGVGATNPLSTAAAGLSMATKAGEWISTPSNWLRVLYIVAGVGVLWIAAEKTVLSSGPGKQVLSVVTGTGGKITSAVKKVGNGQGTAA